MFDFASFASSGREAELLRGDAVAFLKSLPAGCVDSFLTDPPYGIELKLGTSTRQPRRRSIAGDGKAEARALWRSWVPEAFRAAKPDTAHLVFGTWKSPWMAEALSAHFRVAGCIAWNKRVFGLGYYLRPQWEMAYLCVKGRPPKPAKVPGDVWDHCRELRPLHPCQKPVELLRRGVRLVAPAEGLIVCDPFAGIFSTGVAAVLEGRRFIGNEIDARFVRMGRARIAAATAVK
jgi:DNA modification methylase